MESEKSLLAFAVSGGKLKMQETEPNVNLMAGK